MYERPLVRQIVARLKEPRRFVQVVMGPRQVGKTTMLKQALAAADSRWTTSCAAANGSPRSR